MIAEDRKILDIVNQKDVDKLIRKDKVISNIYDQYGAPPNWTRPQGFISLSMIILEQQVSLASAKAHFIKLDTYMKAFTPSNILMLSDEEMRTCQISRQKSTYLRCLSAAILNGELDFGSLPHLSEKKVREILTSLKGIGDWTTDIYLMFCLQAKNIFPPGDIAVINTMKELYKLTTKEEAVAVAEEWKPYKSLGTYFMWHYYLSKRNKQAP